MPEEQPRNGEDKELSLIKETILEYVRSDEYKKARAAKKASDAERRRVL